MKIPSQAYLDSANHGFAAGVRTAVAAFLQELHDTERTPGEDTDERWDLSVLAHLVRTSTGNNILDPTED